MTGNDIHMSERDSSSEDELLQKLLRLKRYETAETARMTRNKQMIMRQVREISRTKKKTIGDLIEVSFPWLFAEPKYGVALLFVAFAGLQYLGANDRHAVQNNSGIYTTSTEQYASFGQPGAFATNYVEYPELPEGLRLFPDRQYNRGDLVPVGNPSPLWQD